MSPSFSSKNGVRYRFYVSSALLRGKHEKAGSVTRVSAVRIEATVTEAIINRFLSESDVDETLFGFTRRIISRVEIKPSNLQLTTTDGIEQQIAWRREASKEATPSTIPIAVTNVNEKLLQTIIRAHAWLQMLSDGTYKTVEELASVANIHPKIVRQSIAAGFLAPPVVEAVVRGNGVSVDRPPHFTVCRADVPAF